MIEQILLHEMSSSEKTWKQLFQYFLSSTHYEGFWNVTLHKRDWSSQDKEVSDSTTEFSATLVQSNVMDDHF